MERQEHVQLRRRLARTDLAAVAEVRCALREFLRYRWRGDSAEVAELLLSELVTNALIHTDHGAVVTVNVTPMTLRVEVRDFVTGLPMPYAPDADDGTHGRGLVLVRALADTWGVTAQALGKVVWFELDGERL
ncbi:ATP-binding protein [Streptomyces sp. LN785]|uniref:ATP-binding protein n=1 Tax=Streptomyces sp. LN785 TaxID=3112983 RepID=UPI0037214B55